MLPEQDVVYYVGVHLPSVGWVGFPDVHQEEFHLILVFVVDGVHALNLSAEGGSSVAAKDEGNRTLALEV